jgi:hypothetical protein
MTKATVVCSAALAAGALLASPGRPSSGISTFTLVVSGFFSTSVSGTGPNSFAERRRAVGKPGERMEIKLRGESAYGSLDFDATPDVTGKPPFSEKGRYDIGNLGAIGTLTRGRERRTISAKTGELVIEETDEHHVRGHLDFKGPCRNGPEPGACSVHADFDLGRRN